MVNPRIKIFFVCLARFVICLGKDMRLDPSRKIQKDHLLSFVFHNYHNTSFQKKVGGSNTWQIQVQCFDRHNLLPSEFIISIFLCTEPSAAPIDVKATSVSVSEILVAWKHIKESLGRPQGFEVWTELLKISLVIFAATAISKRNSLVTLQQNYILLKFCSVAKKVRNMLFYWHVVH